MQTQSGSVVQQMDREVLVYSRDKQKQRKIKSYNILFESAEVDDPKTKPSRRPKRNFEWSEELTSNIIEEEIESLDWRSGKGVQNQYSKSLSTTIYNNERQ